MTIEHFDVSLSEKIPKVVATRDEILAWNSSNTVWRQGSARNEALPTPKTPSRNKGAYF